MDVPGSSIRRQVVLRQSWQQPLQWCTWQVQSAAAGFAGPLDIASAAARSRAVEEQLRLVLNLCKDTADDAGQGAQKNVGECFRDGSQQHQRSGADMFLYHVAALSAVDMLPVKVMVRGTCKLLRAQKVCSHLHC